MSFLKNTAIFGALALLAKVSAHGIVQGIVADGVYYQGYLPSFKYYSTPPVVAGWSIPDDGDIGFVNDYASPDMICHKGATPGGSYVKVAAGGSVELQWNQWPESHHGPMIDYLASCGDDCTTVDKTGLLFNKIDEAGLVNGDPAPGHWASDDMIANNISWVVTIPSTIAPGKYVLRHEAIALHGAYDVGGAQNYPQCINLEISGTGTDSLPDGTLGTALYTATDPGIHLSIYYPVLTSYEIPGPALHVSGSSPQPSASSSPSASPSSSAPSSDTSVADISTGKPSDAPSMTSNPATSIASVPTDKHPVSLSATPKPTTAVAVPSSPAASSLASSAAAPAETSSTSISAYWGEWPGPSDVASAPASSVVAPVGSSPAAPKPSSTSTSTSPVSFTSTFTGRIGKPTKFTCYAEE